MRMSELKICVTDLKGNAKPAFVKDIANISAMENIDFLLWRGYFEFKGTLDKYNQRFAFTFIVY